jgi:hypothetical protein
MPAKMAMLENTMTSDATITIGLLPRFADGRREASGFFAGTW